MPLAPPRPCNKPGCGKLTHKRFCADHDRDYDRARGSSAARGYGARWRRLRELVLQRDPFCKGPDCLAISAEVDHIVSRLRGGDDSLGNLQGLCKPCHSRKTALEDGRWG